MTDIEQDEADREADRQYRESPVGKDVAARAATRHLPAIQQGGGAMAEMSVEGVLDRLKKIQELMRRAMVKGVDYGIVPGTNSKPTLLKPGAEKLAVMFRMAPKYATHKTFHEDGHLTVESTCKILDMGGMFLGEASSMCSTREAKYAWRKGERVCPECGKAVIIKGKADYGGGWLCWVKKDGCGSKFADDDTRITEQKTERVGNPDLADSHNTVLRIAEKRAYIAAMRLVTGSSALFDEEIPEHGGEAEPEQAKPAKKEPPKEQKKITNEQYQELGDLIDRHGTDLEKFLEHYAIKDVKDLPAMHFLDAVQKIKRKPIPQTTIPPIIPEEEEAHEPATA